ncbi:hypothetical protein IKF15_01205 [Candidatus Saccharibacteria bacterium]|nr:hypothetical protein [Candidatus Saccharibacteria bacterium]
MSKELSTEKKLEKWTFRTAIDYDFFDKGCEVSPNHLDQSLAVHNLLSDWIEEHRFCKEGCVPLVPVRLVGTYCGPDLTTRVDAIPGGSIIITSQLAELISDGDGSLYAKTENSLYELGESDEPALIQHLKDRTRA